VIKEDKEKGVFTESIPVAKDVPISLNIAIKLYILLKDTIDYA